MADVPTPPEAVSVPEVPAAQEPAASKQSSRTGKGAKSGSQNRNSRNMETRQSQERSKEWQPPHLRDTLKNDPNSPWVYRWLRESNDGKADRNNMEAKLREGYELVSPNDEDIRERVARGELHAEGGKITRGGRVLARIPRSFAEERNRYYTDQARLQQQTVDQTLKRNESDVVRYSIESESR